MKRMRHKNKVEKQLTKRNLLLTIAIIVIFSSIVLIYYHMLYSEKRQSILMESEVSARESADNLDKYLSMNIDSVNLAAYTLDEMILEKKTDREIQDYLVAQSTAIKSAVFEDSTGLYGYINGRFFSGTNWVPPADYVATERPWYTNAMMHPGELTILDPYVDVQSGNIMLALGKTLCDGESVISLDVSLDQIQELVEEAVSSGYSDMEMILNDEGMVVAHSDPSENGKNYHAEPGSLGESIVSKLDAGAGSSFELRYDGVHYIVYAADIQNGWHCIALKDATGVFRSLNLMLLLTIAIIVFIVHVVSVIMSRSARYRNLSVNAIAANEAKSAFLSNMSHEIRTPINAILGMNEMILRESTEQSTLTYAQNIKKAGGSLLGLVNDILDFSKIEAGKVEIVPVDYDLSTLIGDLLNMIQTRADEKQLELKTRIDEGIPRLLHGDEIRLKGIITNLLTNAVKYTEKGTVSFEIGFERIPEEEDVILLRVYVKDTGIGIREEDMERLFRKFERIEEDRNRYIEGTGLGLSITKDLLEMMGSDLEVKSVYGEGSTFGFRIKQQVVGWDPIGDFETIIRENSEKKGYRVKFTAPGASILAVDDNPMNLIVFTNLVKETGVSVDTGINGEEGLKRSCEKKYDMIFLDHMMPVKDGIETLRCIRRDTWNPNIETPIVCLTANAVSGAREKYLEAGFDDYLTKPIDPTTLENMMLAYLPTEKVVMSTVLEEEEAPDEMQIPEDLIALTEKGIDVAFGIKNSKDADSYRVLLKVFYESAGEKAKELEEYLEKGDENSYTIKVHALKSSARIIGAMDLGEKAQKLENAGKSGDSAYILENHSPFMKELRGYEELIGGLFPKEETDENKPEADEERMAEVFAELLSAADDMDCDRLEDTIAEMESYRIPEKDRPLYEKVKGAVNNYDYTAIVELLQKD